MTNQNPKTVLVTGATKGIGRGIASVFLAQGHRVTITGISAEECDEARSWFSERADAADRLECAVADVSRRADCEAMVEVAVQRFGGLDVLCANAGVYPQQRLEALTEEDLDRILAINVKGTVFSVQAARPHLIRSGRGRVVLTSSITGPFTGYPGWSHYGATKAAQLGFMRTAAMELAPDGVTVNAVLPGNILSEGLAELGEAYLERMAATIPLGYLGAPEDIGEAAAFLASDGARYITGQTIVVDGGQLLPESPDALADMRPTT